jgi:hypothetical protein
VGYCGLKRGYGIFGAIAWRRALKGQKKENGEARKYKTSIREERE